MERHGRRQHSGRQTARQRAGKKLNFESLERRSLLSAAGFLPFSPPVLFASPVLCSPPAMVGEMHPRLSAAIDMQSASSTDPPSRNPLATMDVGSNALGSDNGFASSGRDLGDRGVRIAPSSFLNVVIGGSSSNEDWPVHFGTAATSPGIVARIGATEYGTISGDIAANPAAVVSLYEPHAITTISFDTSSVRSISVISYTNLPVAPLLQHAVMGSSMLDGQNGQAGDAPAAVDRAPAAHPPMQTAPSASHNPAVSTSSLNLTVVDGYSEPPILHDLFAVMDAPAVSHATPTMIGMPIRPVDAGSSYVSPAALSTIVDTSPIVDTATATASHYRDAVTWHAAASAVAADGKPVLPLSTGPNGPAIYNRSSPDFAPAGSAEGGFVTIDETTGATARTSNSASSASADSGGDNSSGLMQDGSPSGLKTSNQTIGNDRAQGDKRTASATYSSAHAKASPQSSADFVEGGAIELDDAPAAIAVASRQPATTGAAEIRPESGTALLCDMEVAVGPASGDARDSQQDPAPVVVLPTAAEVRDAAKAKKPAEDAPLPRDARQQTSAAATGNAPLLLGATFLALARGIRQDPDDQNQPRGTAVLWRPWKRRRG